MGKTSHITMIENAFKELGDDLTLNEIMGYINSNWYKIAPTRQKVRHILSSRPQFFSREKASVMGGVGANYQTNIWNITNGHMV